MDASRRKDVRYQARFPAELVFGRKRLSLLTEDLSYRGVFLRTDTPPPLRQLVKVRLVLPFVGRAMEMHGMTVHVVEYENLGQRVPGVGIQFYGLDRDTRETWEAAVRHVETTAPLAADQSPFAIPAHTPELIRRRLERHTAVLTLKLKTREELQELVTRNIAVGGAFVPTTERLREGAPVMLCLHHPENDSTFILDGVVHQSRGDGVGIDLVGLDAARREELDEFVQGGIIIGEAEVLSQRSPDT